MTKDLEARAASIPHMGARNIGGHLRIWASACHSNIVEIGSWLGAGTAYLALGARESGARLHVYDRWRANDSEVQKAKACGFKLKSGQDTLPLVRQILEPFGVPIVFHQGPADDATWNGEPIGLLVLDAAKRGSAFDHVAATFFPHLESGAMLILMDFHHYEHGGDRYRDQQRYMAAHPEFVMLAERLGGDTAAAVFVCRR